VFIRQNKNRSGSISVQVVSKFGGKYKVLYTAGSSLLPEPLELLKIKAQKFIEDQSRSLSLFVEKEDLLVQAFVESLSNNNLRIVGPQLILDKVYELLFPITAKPYFKDLVLCRIIYPGSKLRTVEYLARHFNIEVSAQTIYRALDTLDDDHKKIIEDCTYQYIKTMSGGEVSLVFYDMTTLYFETETEDDLRKIGYSKDGKHQHPQIMIGLLVDAGGHPIAYDVFEGNKAETKTLLPIIEHMVKRFNLSKPIIVADAALLSKENLSLLQTNGYSYILGGRIRNENKLIKEIILQSNVTEGTPVALSHPYGRLIVSYSQSRSNKDFFNRQKGLKRLEQKVKSNKLTKEAINNRGYNKYLKLDGETKVSIDRQAFEADKVWDGLKGYVTNTDKSPEEIIGAYSSLWQVEKAFRMSKSDLRFRPIYHRKANRIKSHLIICFTAYATYKALEKIMKDNNLQITPQKAIDTLKEVQEITYQLPKSKIIKTQLLKLTALQNDILKMKI
jgi:transposase